MPLRPAAPPVPLPPAPAVADADAEGTADCTRCDAVCCRLTVVLQPEDRVAEHLDGGSLTDVGQGAGVERLAHGLALR